MEVIYSCKRKQAIEDGVLCDLGKLAREAGFRIPVAVTKAVWQRCIAVPAGVSWQDETGRAWDILVVMSVAANVSPDPRLLQFSVSVLNEPNRAENVKLKAIVGPGDDSKPVITVMFPEES